MQKSTKPRMRQETNAYTTKPRICRETGRFQFFSRLHSPVARRSILVRISWRAYEVPPSFRSGHPTLASNRCARKQRRSTGRRHTSPYVPTADLLLGNESQLLSNKHCGVSCFRAETRDRHSWCRRFVEPRACAFCAEEVSDLVDQETPVIDRTARILPRLSRNRFNCSTTRCVERNQFCTSQDFHLDAEARACSQDRPSWPEKLRGDLQMHSQWERWITTIAEWPTPAKEHARV